MENQGESILAFDARESSFGFVVFSGPHCLVDWGMKNFRGGASAVHIPVRARISALFDDFSPDAVVLRTEDRHDRVKRRKMRDTIISESTRRGIPVKFIPRTATKTALISGNGNKYQIAAAVAKRFPELAPKRPLVHKIWMHERYWMRMFDAAALGIVYFNEHQAPLPLPDTQR